MKYEGANGEKGERKLELNWINVLLSTFLTKMLTFLNRYHLAVFAFPEGRNAEISFPPNLRQKVCVAFLGINYSKKGREKVLCRRLQWKWDSTEFDFQFREKPFQLLLNFRLYPINGMDAIKKSRRKPFISAAFKSSFLTKTATFPNFCPQSDDRYLLSFGHL